MITLKEAQQRLQYHKNVAAWWTLREQYERMKPGSGYGGKAKARPTAKCAGVAKAKAGAAKTFVFNIHGCRSTFHAKPGTTRQMALDKLARFRGRRLRVRGHECAMG